MSKNSSEQSGMILISRKNLALAYKPGPVDTASYQQKLEGKIPTGGRRNKRSPFTSDPDHSHMPSAAVSTPQS